MAYYTENYKRLADEYYKQHKCAGGVTDISKLAAKRYAELSATEKARYTSDVCFFQLDKKESKGAPQKPALSGGEQKATAGGGEQKPSASDDGQKPAAGDGGGGGRQKRVADGGEQEPEPASAGAPTMNPEAEGTIGKEGAAPPKESKPPVATKGSVDAKQKTASEHGAPEESGAAEAEKEPATEPSDVKSVRFEDGADDLEGFSFVN